VLLKGCGQDLLALTEDRGSQAIVNHVRCQQGDAAVVAFVVVPMEEGLAMGAGVFQRAKQSGKYSRALSAARPS
jgi:hypothetical protein